MTERGAILYLLGRTLLELAALPFHLAWFVVTRRRVRADIAAILADQARAHRAAADA